MWRKSKPLENGDHNALIFNFMGGGEETRSGVKFLHTKTHYTREEGRKGGKKEETEEKHQSLFE